VFVQSETLVQSWSTGFTLLQRMSTEHEREALYRNLHSKLHTNRSRIPITKSNVIDQSLKARLTRCTPQDGPLLSDMLVILDAERSTNDGVNGMCGKKNELAEEIFEDLLMDYVAVQSMDNEDQGTKGIEELMDAINQAVVFQELCIHLGFRCCLQRAVGKSTSDA
jgi:hypothetical protein